MPAVLQYLGMYHHVQCMQKKCYKVFIAKTRYTVIRHCSAVLLLLEAQLSGCVQKHTLRCSCAAPNQKAVMMDNPNHVTLASLHGRMTSKHNILMQAITKLTIEGLRSFTRHRSMQRCFVPFHMYSYRDKPPTQWAASLVGRVAHNFFFFTGSF